MGVGFKSSVLIVFGFNRLRFVHYSFCDLNEIAIIDVVKSKDEANKLAICTAIVINFLMNFYFHCKSIKL